MKNNVLVIYYSSTGATEYIAQKIAEISDADILELKPINDISKKGFLRMIVGGYMAITDKIIPLHEFKIDPSNYDLIFLGTPVWAGKPTPAINSLLSYGKIKNKKIALFTTYDAKEGKTTDIIQSKLYGNNFLGSIGFLKPLKQNKNVLDEKIKSWVLDILSKAE